MLLVEVSKVLQNFGLAICKTFDKSLAGLAQDLQDLKKSIFCRLFACHVKKTIKISAHIQSASET